MGEVYTPQERGNRMRKLLLPFVIAALATFASARGTPLVSDGPYANLSTTFIDTVPATINAAVTPLDSAPEVRLIVIGNMLDTPTTMSDNGMTYGQRARESIAINGANTPVGIIGAAIKLGYDRHARDAVIYAPQAKHEDDICIGDMARTSAAR